MSEPEPNHTAQSGAGAVRGAKRLIKSLWAAIVKTKVKVTVHVV